MTAATRLILVRHAEPTTEMRGRIYGRLDIDLSPAGRRHADRLARELARQPVAFLFTSPMRRAMATAAPIGAALGIEPIVMRDLREIDFGELEGLTVAEVEQRYPAEVRWTEAPALVSFPGGESVAALRDRALGAIREIVDRSAGETVVVVSHAVAIRAVLADALGMPLDSMFRLDQSYGGISVVEWFGEKPLVRLVNAASSIPA